MANTETNITGEGTIQPTPPTGQVLPPQSPTGTAAQPVQDGNAQGTVNPSPMPPTQPSAHDSIIAQLQAQNAALMQQNNLLNQQVINLVQNGGQFTNAQPAQPQPAQPAVAAHPTQAEQLAAMGMQFEAQPSYMQPPASLSNAPDMALESLASDIGKDRPKH